MSHAATFVLSEGLADLFAKEASSDGTLACMLVSILDEAFTLGATVPLGASAEADFEATKRLLSEDEATYLLFRLLRGGESQGWAFISFVPDTAPVKQKMLYANAKDTLKKKLPGGEAYATMKPTEVLAIETEQRDKLKYRKGEKVNAVDE